MLGTAFEFLMQHLPALQVVVPMMAAPICLMLHRGSWAGTMALITAIACFIMSVLLLQQVMTTGPISYHLGGWAPPFGIEYRVDAMNAFVLVIVAATSALVLSFAGKSIRGEIEPSKQALFYTVFTLCLCGLLGVTITGDAFNIFVFVEVSSLATYVLIAMGARRDRRALTASYTYLMMGTIGATFYVIGLGLLYQATGTLNLADLAVRLEPLGDSTSVRAGFAFIMVGLGLKLAMFPIHAWLPNAYTYAPSVVSIFLAATSTKVAIYVLLRFMFTVFGYEFPVVELSLSAIFMPLALLAMFVASAIAVFQTDFKRLLAYSSVAQIGYMILGFSMASVTGLTATMVHIFNHAAMKGVLFMVAGAVVYRVGSSSVASFAGLGRQMPWTMAALVIGGLSLIGVPLTVGFISKWYLILGALETGDWVIAFAIVLSSLIAVVYVWRVVEVAYLTPAPEGAKPVREAPLSMLLPMWTLALACLYFGLNAELTATIGQAVAETLLNGDTPTGTPVIEELAQ
ncbi:monovalent cation/H+ antiporter subunit D family protein [Pyruvatibacter sp.]|uniref:monovalent cation/H+ antiporter subunit D family protein n=1 Tax=Pyruvatibacter sp. TaxID=1981328 RepID=UPI0032EC53EE